MIPSGADAKNTYPEYGGYEEPDGRAGDAGQDVDCSRDDPEHVGRGEDGGPDGIEEDHV